MDTDFSEKLQGFDKVWQRVQQQKKNAGTGARPKTAPPARTQNSGRSKRFKPGGF